MAYSTAYSNLSYEPKVLSYQQDFSWLDNIAQKRSEQDQKAYLYIDDLKNKALNIRFLNQSAQKVVNGYNTEIDNFFKQNDLSKVDLADYKTANSYTKIFNNLVSDTNLTNAYQVDKQIQSTLGTWKEAAKNPSKTGYSEANYNVWQNEHLIPYIQETDMNKLPTFNAGIFDPKYDYQKELKGLKSQVHFDGKKFDVMGKDGSKQTWDIQELTPEKLQIFFKGALSGEATSQMMKEAKSAFYNQYNSIPAERRGQLAQGLYEQDKQMYNDNKSRFDIKIEETKGKLAVASPEDKEKLQQELNIYTDQSKKFTFNKTVDEYTTLSKLELANQYAGRSLHEKLDNYAKGMAYQVKKVTSGINENYWKIQKFNFDVNNESYDRNRDKVKDAQWQMGYDLNVAKYQHDVEDDAAKNALKDAKSARDAKVSASSNGYFSGIADGEVDSGVTTIEDIDKNLGQLNAQLQTVNPETLTKEQAKGYIDNKNDNSPIANAIKTYALQNGYNGTVTDGLLGQLKGYVKNELEQGNLHTYFNDLKTQRNLYQKVKDDTWNKIMNDHIYTQNPSLRGAKPEVIQKFFDNNPSLAKQVKTYWNSELTSSMMSVKGNNFLIDLEKDKVNHYRNLNMVTSTLNSDKKLLNELGIKDGTAITSDMISSAEYSPITGKTKITLNSDAVKKDDDINGLNGRVITVDTPTSIRQQYGVDYSQKDKLANLAGYIDGSYKKATYKISKDVGSNNKWHVVIMKGDQVVINTLAGFSPSGEYRSATPMESDSVTDIENKVHEIINKMR